MLKTDGSYGIIHGNSEKRPRKEEASLAWPYREFSHNYFILRVCVVCFRFTDLIKILNLDKKIFKNISSNIYVILFGNIGVCIPQTFKLAHLNLVFIIRLNSSLSWYVRMRIMRNIPFTLNFFLPSSISTNHCIIYLDF